MKKCFFITIILGFSAIGNSQQKQTDKTVVKFAPPIIVKDDVNAKHKPAKVAKFKPPVIVKDKPSESKVAKRKTARFTPPVIVKDSAKNK